MSPETKILLSDLAQNAESVCRHYLPAGRREGSYWIVGDLQNNPGRSLFVRLTGPASGPGAAGKFTEYVAPKIMLRSRDWSPPCRRLAASTQHNLGAREVS